MPNNQQTMMRQIVYAAVIFVVIFSSRANAQSSAIFPKGELAAEVNHTGDVWLNALGSSETSFDHNITLATFAAGAKLNWHVHPAGQQLLILQGTGLYQERGEAVRVVHTGDVIECAPGVEHWHAATPETSVTYLAITGNEPTQWLEPVTEELFNSVDIPSTDSADMEQDLIELSETKWQWMAEKDIESLENLFHEKSVFVHMGGSWGKQQELDIIEGGMIWYKDTDIHEVSVDVIDDTAVLLNRITLVAEVEGNEVSNPFEVTEVYKKENDSWKLLTLSFTRLMN